MGEHWLWPISCYREAGNSSVISSMVKMVNNWQVPLGISIIPIIYSLWCISWWDHNHMTLIIWTALSAKGLCITSADCIRVHEISKWLKSSQIQNLTKKHPFRRFPSSMLNLGIVMGHVDKERMKTIHGLTSLMSVRYMDWIRWMTIVHCGAEGKSWGGGRGLTIWLPLELKSDENWM